MALQSSFYTGTALTSRTFPSSKHIATKAHMAIWIREKDIVPPAVSKLWIRINDADFELINNSAVLVQTLNETVYDSLEVRVADQPDELTDSQSDISTVAGISNEIVIVAGIKQEVITVAQNDAQVKIVGDDLLLGKGTNQPTDSAILNALENANIATTKASEALASSDAAQVSENNSALSASSALLSKNSVDARLDATDSAGNTVNENLNTVSTEPVKSQLADAETNAQTATTKAGEASASATQAQLYEWIAEAEKMTANSYAVEPEDVLVKLYTSNGDGSFSNTNTTDYSALHWDRKTKGTYTGNSQDLLNQIKTVDGTGSGLDADMVDGVHAKDGMATAWVNFDGTNGGVRASYNISSVIRISVGRYQIFFQTAMDNTSYVGVVTGSTAVTNVSLNGTNLTAGTQQGTQFNSVSSFFCNVDYPHTNAVFDLSMICIIVYGGKN